MIPAGSPARFVAGSRVLSDPASRSGRTAALDTAGDRRWLENGEVPGGRAFASMNQQALLDLRSLTAADGAVIAGWTPAWRYVWPRDASFAVAAYAATGHHDDAVRVLSYLARIAPADGRWQARYLPDGSGAAPDGRGVQLDGAGWCCGLPVSTWPAHHPTTWSGRPRRSEAVADECPRRLMRSPPRWIATVCRRRRRTTGNAVNGR